MKAYLFQNPEGWYRKKGTRGSHVQKPCVNCLFASRESIRTSAYGLMSASIKAETNFPSAELKETDSKAYWQAVREAWARASALPNARFLELLQADGFKITEVEINIP